MSNFLSGTRMHSAVLTVALTAGVALPAAAESTGQMQGMDHSQMQGMDQGQMQGMDHSQMKGMDHSKMEGMQPAKQPQTQSRTPIPPLTDADRAAVYNAPGGHEVHDSALNSFFIFEKLEWQDADDGSALNWEAQGWIGGDVDRLWLRTEGERTNGKTEEAEVHALWGHAISPWWDLVGGVRQDFKPGDPQTWAAFGIQGLALYNFEAQATAYLGEGGQTAARLEGDYDILLTNKLILQPTAEFNFYGKNDPQRGVGSGLSESEIGLRLRYEFRPQFAPYVGVTWNRAYGKTADYARDEGEDNNEARLVLGVRVWF
ncbi:MULTISPECIES: copper resistance protein B [Pseudomonas]|jgi:copper resistance protein B|uniref:Copper resistance protein B n=3 Tax=Pseudomonas TaxID=286 RepID=A0A5E7SAM0_PSEFL|nr:MULTISPECIES: copper resistance protein B [Pseudomonas]MCX4063438.1 copper resistance protein B [Pseudomonas quebecensis]MDD0987835.1 copper resistance protein B [Pseudomonas shahriarae]MDD1032492.1 copper resistance protein B [Pseudomonas shahriarae]UZW17880.1 copper resistance protein B [Pseudomonas quebecensis]UZW24706.1 copper resistance protein B [Pseudomonas quebecensis]